CLRMVAKYYGKSYPADYLREKSNITREGVSLGGIADAAETAEVLGLEHYYKRINFTDFITTMRECIRIVEEPLATTSIIPMFFLAELASQYVKVVLTGQGADEPLGGYTRYKSELIQDKVPAFLHGLLSKAVQVSKIKNEKIIRGTRTLGIKDEIERFLTVYQVFTTTEIEQLIGVTDSLSAERIAYFHRTLNCGVKSHSVERMMALDARLNLADDLLNYTDKVTMHFSLECRVPMLDLDLVKYIESLPAAAKLNFKGGKIVHKQFARNLLPDAIINRKKKGFQSPTKQWFKHEMSTIQEILLRDGTPFSKVFNTQFVNEILQ
ncbi:MAG: asparagine synthase-related protein, partial [Bacteroidota bacterium]